MCFLDELERIYIRGEFSHYFSLSSPVILTDNAQQEGIVLAKMIYNNRFANPEYLTEVRIRHACCLIDTYGRDVPLMEIASKCGYNDYVYFSKKFKSITGISPRTYIANTFD